MRESISTVRPDVPLVVTLPFGHWAETYGGSHPGRIPTGNAIRAWAVEHDLPVVDYYECTRTYVERREGNPDGLHWGFAAHKDVADAFLQVIHN